MHAPYYILRDDRIVLGTFTYPIDLVVKEIPEDDFCPIISGRPYWNTTGAIIDCKREVIYLLYIEEEREFHFSEFKTRLRQNKDKSTKENTIAQLVATYFETPEDELIRSLTEYEQKPQGSQEERD